MSLATRCDSQDIDEQPLPPGSFTCTGAGLSNRVVAHLTGVIGPPCPNRAITFERETMRLARSKGQLGNNAAIKNSATPVQVKAKVGDLPGMKAIAASSAHCLALIRRHRLGLGMEQQRAGSLAMVRPAGHRAHRRRGGAGAPMARSSWKTH